MNRRRVKITGVGPVTPAGIGREAFGKGIQESISRVRPVTRFDPLAGPFVAAEVRGFKITDHFSENGVRRLPRHTQFALAGAKLALADAGLDFDDLEGMSSAVMIGATLMDIENMTRTILRVERKGPKAAVPKGILLAPVSAITAAVAERIPGSVRTMAVQSACCSGMDSIGHAAGMVASGEVDIAICGGTEAPLLQCPMIEFKLVGLAPDSSDMPERIGRPFDLWRTTGVIGEGAGVVVLEPESSPRPAYGWIGGYGFSSDPDSKPGSGILAAASLSIANARLRARDIEVISAWGPGHRSIDRIEADVLGTLFGHHLQSIPALSIKGAIGNPLAAAGPIQVIAAVLGFRERMIPPTVNWCYPDPACPLNLSSAARYVETGTALINAHGISGMNSCLVLTAS